jgi:hypothetical protein
MKKRIFLLLVCLLALTVSLCFFVACDKEGAPDKGDGTTDGESTNGGTTDGGTSGDGTTDGETTDVKADHDGTEGLEFFAVSDNAYGVKAGDAKYMDKIVIPATYKDKPVTKILDGAFEDATNLTSIVIPNSITEFGENAFYECDNLEKTYYAGDIASWLEIDFKDSDANPVYYSKNFYIDNKLVTEVVIPDTVKSIKKYVFAGCSNLASITTGSDVKSIGNGAFNNCEKLTEIKYNATECDDLSDYQTVFSDYALEDTGGLTLIVGDNVKRIPAGKCSNDF